MLVAIHINYPIVVLEIAKYDTCTKKPTNDSVLI